MTINEHLCSKCGFDCINDMPDDDGVIECPVCRMTVADSESIRAGTAQPNKVPETQLTDSATWEGTSCGVVAECRCGYSGSVTLKDLANGAIKCPECGKDLSIGVICPNCDEKVFATRNIIGDLFDCPKCNEEQFWNWIIGDDGKQITLPFTGEESSNEIAKVILNLHDQIESKMYSGARNACQPKVKEVTEGSDDFDNRYLCIECGHDCFNEKPVDGVVICPECRLSVLSVDILNLHKTDTKRRVREFNEKYPRKKESARKENVDTKGNFTKATGSSKGVMVSAQTSPEPSVTKGFRPLIRAICPRCLTKVTHPDTGPGFRIKCHECTLEFVPENITRPSQESSNKPTENVTRSIGNLEIQVNPISIGDVLAGTFWFLVFTCLIFPILFLWCFSPIVLFSVLAPSNLGDMTVSEIMSDSQLFFALVISVLYGFWFYSSGVMMLIFEIFNRIMKD